MRSIADALRDEDRRHLEALTPAQRLTLALALGERDLEAFRLAHAEALHRDQAIRLLERRRQVGRRRSRCVEELIG